MAYLKSRSFLLLLFFLFSFFVSFSELSKEDVEQYSEDAQTMYVFLTALLGLAAIITFFMVYTYFGVPQAIFFLIVCLLIGFVLF
jgi:fatty acid desaturase